MGWYNPSHKDVIFVIQFQRVTPALRDTIAPLLMASGRRGAEYSFANLCMWGRQAAVRSRLPMLPTEE